MVSKYAMGRCWESSNAYNLGAFLGAQVRIRIKRKIDNLALMLEIADSLLSCGLLIEALLAEALLAVAVIDQHVLGSHGFSERSDGVESCYVKYTGGQFGWEKGVDEYGKGSDEREKERKKLRD